MAGIKRIRTEHAQEGYENRIAPNDYSFNFIPTLKPSQKIFDIEGALGNSTPTTNLQPVNFSINTLTHRFRTRSENLRVSNKKSPSNSREKLNATAITTTTTTTRYEPMYLRHRDISYTIITYLQMSFNIIITVTVLYIFSKMILVVKQDFKLKAQEHVDSLHKDKLACTKDYIVNHCRQEDQVPAIESMCEEWLSCMQKDIVVAQAKVSAEAIAEIINSFVEPIAYKTLAFFTVLILGSLLFSNLAFTIFRKNYTGTPAALEHH